MNHSEEFGRATWAGANMSTSWTSKLHFFTLAGKHFLFLHFEECDGQNQPGEQNIV